MPPRLDALTPLRFVAAAMIVVGHGATLFGFAPGPAALHAANAGVSFFFVLSGFVLAYNYPALADRGARQRFFAMRFARIWPLHAFTLLAVIVLLPRAAWVVPGVDPWIAGVLSLLLLQAWVPVAGYAGAFNGPAWTLSVDVFFYAMFPLVLARVREAPARALTGALLLSVAFPMVANALGGARSDIPLDRWNWYLLDHFFPPARLVEFVLGMVAATGFVSMRDRLPRSVSMATLAEAAALAACAGGLAFLHRVPHAGAWVGPGVGDWLTQVAAAPLFATLLIVLASGRGALSRVLAMRVPVHLGDLGYAVYLMHGLVLHAAVWPSLTASIGGAASLAAFWIALVAVAHLAWRFVELPARRGIVRAFDRRAAIAASRGRDAARQPSPSS
ncbi:MAG: acyltransferase [Betaproteobacteria bacterium]|nr:acyltransferase [Betaproteobacteria bacterium]